MVRSLAVEDRPAQTIPVGAQVLDIVPYQRKGEKAGGCFWVLPAHSPTGAAQTGTSDAT
jgi:hypothetical protein